MQMLTLGNYADSCIIGVRASTAGPSCGLTPWLVDNKVLPMQLTPERARDEPKWWYDPRYAVFFLFLPQSPWCPHILISTQVYHNVSFPNRMIRDGIPSLMVDQRVEREQVRPTMGGSAPLVPLTDAKRPVLLRNQHTETLLRSPRSTSQALPPRLETHLATTAAKQTTWEHTIL